MSRDDDDIRPAVAVAGAVILLGTIVFVVLFTTLAPAFGIAAGQPPDTVIGTMIVAFLVLVGAVSGAVFDRWRRNGDS